MINEDPGHHYTSARESKRSNGKFVCDGIGDARLSKEINGVTGDDSAIQVLTHEGHATNFSAAQVNTPEAIKIRSARLKGHLCLDSVSHHGYRSGGINIFFLRRQPLDHLFGLLQLSLTNENPWRLGREP